MRVQEDKEKNPKTEPDKDLDEGDKNPDTKQGTKDRFEEKKAGEEDEDEGSGIKPMPRACKCLNWWRKRWPASSDLRLKVQEDEEKNPKTEPDKDLDEADKKPDTKQVTKDHFEEKKAGEEVEDEALGIKPMPRACKCLNWWRKRWPASSDI